MLRLISVICCLFLLGACNTVTPHLNVYDGLLPPGYQITDSPDPLRPATLRNKTVVVVTTTNFNNYAQRWIETYDKSNVDNRKAQIGWLVSSFDANVAATRQASDPRILAERVMGTLRGSFKTVKVASDFAAARELKADYIVLVDYLSTFNAMGDVFSARGGVYLLDEKLRRVFAAEGKADIDRGSDHVGARMMEKALNTTMSQIFPVVNNQLGVAQR